MGTPCSLVDVSFSASSVTGPADDSAQAAGENKRIIRVIIIVVWFWLFYF
jgi:hypothetical protein